MTRGYYAYIFDDDGHISNRVDVVCDNDDEAKRCALQLVGGHIIELWQETRMVATFRPKHLRSQTPLALHHCPSRSTLDVEADEALETARAIPTGPEKFEALKKAGLLRAAADARGITFAKRGRPPK